jgi:hypothetical protein
VLNPLSHLQCPHPLRGLSGSIRHQRFRPHDQRHHLVERCSVLREPLHAAHGRRPAEAEAQRQERRLYRHAHVVRALAVAAAHPDLDYDDAVELHLLLEAVGRITEALNE